MLSKSAPPHNHKYGGRVLAEGRVQFGGRVLVTMITKSSKIVPKSESGPCPDPELWQKGFAFCIPLFNVPALVEGGVLLTEGGCRVWVELCNTRCGNPKTVGVLLVCYSTRPPARQ